ncbi:TVP38/TMEM64 family protein [Pararhizobium sp.]|uniref:TVP38/TMEM64 family protein n=1 Tax=Pararhizobium sp. TaxID=1977563 RepID=UPI002721426B|nr:TVP38/TMEM64 family protein [Pararhizobium sp.]MDO9416403.1 TVP38/TMEM64 family protein [Pararhizobium sp.]
MSEPAGQAKSGAGRYLPVAVILAGLVLAYAFGLQRYLSLDMLSANNENLKSAVAANPVRSAAIFFAIYVLAVAFSLPAASILTIVAGFLFGLVAGGAIVVLAATTGACIVFLAARTAFGDILKRRAGSYLDRFAEGFRADAFNYLLILRLAPVFPFFVVNIAPAFFAISLGTFALATFIGIIPGTLAYVWLGCGLESALADAAAAGKPLSVADFATWKITLAFAILALVAAMPLALRKWRNHRKLRMASRTAGEKGRGL